MSRFDIRLAIAIGVLVIIAAFTVVTNFLTAGVTGVFVGGMNAMFSTSGISLFTTGSVAYIACRLAIKHHRD